MTRAHWDELIAHAREEAPNECCGIVRIRDGVVLDVSRAANEQPSPMYGYQLDGYANYLAYQAEEEGLTVGVYHSHPRSSAEPSQTDINLAEYPGRLYVIASPIGNGEIRAWWIVEGKVTEEEIVVDDR
jgi:[CysO sulfur-carrier protein]-S-L-cysteine hydrolase